MSPVQMEGPRICTSCEGTGVAVTFRTCGHQGNCPCGEFDTIACERCDGSTFEPCDSCGEPSADRYLGQDLCDACLPTEERRFSSCSICDRPIDVRESRVPLCPSCEGTARVAGEQAAWATRVEREERETGRRIA